MTAIDKDYIKKILDQYADVAVEVNAIKQELIKERGIDDDDKLPWEEQNTIKTFLNFGMTRLLDEYLPKGQH